jgi:uncharacterized membrane protein YoaK (UPF0700 family)
MDASASGESPDFLQDSARRADTDREGREGAVTVATFVAALGHSTLRTRLLLLLLTLTLAAGWTDALSYLVIGRVWASFMTGNILFVGISIAQGNPALLLREGVAIVLFLVSLTLGSRYLQTLPARQSVASWRSTFARYLLGEGLILLAFALVWSLTGNLAQHPAVQVVLLGIAAFGMGLQGALLGAFNILDVNTVALTGTDLLLGIRLAQRIGRQSVDEPGGTSAPFLVALLLAYALAAFVVAFVVALAAPWVGMAFVPCLLVAGAAAALALPARRKVTGSVVRDRAET